MSVYEYSMQTEVYNIRMHWQLDIAPDLQQLSIDGSLTFGDIKRISQLDPNLWYWEYYHSTTRICDKDISQGFDRLVLLW